MYTGLSSSATAIACSGGRMNVSSSLSYSRYPPAACAEAHSRTYRSAAPLRSAISSLVSGPAPASAFHRPSSAPIMTSAPFNAAPMSGDGLTEETPEALLIDCRPGLHDAPFVGDGLSWGAAAPGRARRRASGRGDAVDVDLQDVVRVVLALDLGEPVDARRPGTTSRQ